MQDGSSGHCVASVLRQERVGKNQLESVMCLPTRPVFGYQRPDEQYLSEECGEQLSVGGLRREGEAENSFLNFGSQPTWTCGLAAAMMAYPHSAPPKPTVKEQSGYRPPVMAKQPGQKVLAEKKLSTTLWKMGGYPRSSKCIDTMV